jgi:PRC-barrel domain
MATENMARTGQTDETDRLISSEKVEGTNVYNRNRENIGSINHLMIDKISGQVEYAVMSTGGFLGIGESYSPVPWDSLVYDVNLGGYLLDADRARLEQAPRFTSSARPNWSDRSYAERVNDYWHVGRV